MATKTTEMLYSISISPESQNFENGKPVSRRLAMLFNAAASVVRFARV